MATKTKRRIPGVVSAAADAAIEIGQAARDLKSSWAHVQRAKKRGARAARPAIRMAKKTVKAAKRGAKKVVKRVRSKKRR